MHWKSLDQDQLFALMDSFSIVEAAALIAGHPPSSVGDYWDDAGENQIWGLRAGDHHQRMVFDLAKASLERAVLSGRLPALIMGTYHNYGAYKQEANGDWKLLAEPNLSKTFIQRDDLTDWLESRNCRPEFFFSEKVKHDFMNQEHDHYSPKLAATVAAWEAASHATETGAINGSSPKTWIKDWLKVHAVEYGVTNDKETDDAFEQMATTANWKPKGGRPSSKKTSPQINQGQTKRMLDVDKKRTIRSDLDMPLVPPSPHHPVSDIDDDLPF